MISLKFRELDQFSRRKPGWQLTASLEFFVRYKCVRQLKFWTISTVEERKIQTLRDSDPKNQQKWWTLQSIEHFRTYKTKSKPQIQGRFSLPNNIDLCWQQIIWSQAIIQKSHTDFYENDKTVMENINKSKRTGENKSVENIDARFSVWSNISLLRINFPKMKNRF